MKPFIAVVFSALLLGGCASMSYSELPSVSVTSVSLAPHPEGVLPNFLIGLRVVNPNRATLPLVGMSYSLEVEDARILSGAAGDLPEVPAYGNADIVVELSPDLFGSARLLGGLMSGHHEALDFRFKARLDVGGWRPDIRIEETGRLDLGSLAQP